MITVILNKKPHAAKALRGAGTRVSREKPTNLGAKVYKKHRVMLRKLARQETREEGRKVSMNEVLRTAIEQLHDRRFNPSDHSKREEGGLRG